LGRKAFLAPLPTDAAGAPAESAILPQWRGSASDLLQIGANRSGWPKSPRALAGGKQNFVLIGEQPTC
jgi:hypothetical protein